MAIDPRQFLVAPANSIINAAARSSVVAARSLIDTASNISNAPSIINAQLNFAINRTISRVPNFISNAAQNIAINTVTSTAVGALRGVLNGQDPTSILTGGVSNFIDTGLSGINTAADQILGQVGLDVSSGINGIVNNLGGGALTGIANDVIANIQSINASAIVDAIGSGNIASLFGGDENIGEVAELISIDESSRQGVYDLIGVTGTQISNCPPETQRLWNAIADSIAFDIADPSTPKPNRDIIAFGQNVKKGMADCAPAPDVVTIKDPKHYASNLYPTYQPKYKFLFMVEFVFHPEYQQLLFSDKHKHGKASFEFVIKNSTRPNVSFEHEEVNMYNFWTKIPKRTTYDPMTMRFYDDDANSSGSFYTNYMRAVSPISNEGGGDTMIFPQQYQENSISPKSLVRPNSTVRFQQSGASLGALNADATTVLSEIRLYHVYDWGRLVNVYHMYNPKVVALNLDDVDMAESGAGNELEMQFVYDGLYVEPSRKTTTELMAKISGANLGPGFEIDPVFDNNENDASGADTSTDPGIVDIKLPGQSPVVGSTPPDFPIFESPVFA